MVIRLKLATYFFMGLVVKLPILKKIPVFHIFRRFGGKSAI